MQVNKRLAILLDHRLSDILLRAYRGSAGQLPLFALARRGSDALVSRLLRLEVDLNETFCHCVGSPTWCRCMPALHTAIAFSNITMVRSLLRHGAKIDTPYGRRGDNAVHLAIETIDRKTGYFGILPETDMKILRMLLGGGRLRTMNDPASLGGRGHTWLNTAVRTFSYRHVTLVELFLSHGLSVDVADRETYCTPLHVAVVHNREDLVALLLNHGADHRTTDSQGRTPFESACNRDLCPIMDLLLRQDVTLIDTVVNARGETAELSLKWHIEQLRINGDGKSKYYLDKIRMRQKLLAKLVKLSKVRKNAAIPDAVLQSYFNSL